MAINPSEQIYCCVSCDSSTNSTSAGHTIRRNDTCPVMEIELKGPKGRPVVLGDDWSASGYLFGITYLLDDIADDVTTIALEDTVNVFAGDIMRIESRDGAEKVTVTAVDRVAHTVDVTRASDGTTAASHFAEIPVYIPRSIDVPVEIVYETSSEEDLRTDIVYVQDVDKLDDNVIGTSSGYPTRTVLQVEWRTSDTAISGKFYLQVTLSGPDGEKLTLPKNSIGYPISIVNDADAVV